MEGKRKNCLAKVLLLFLLLAILAADAQAIPVFARKYKTSCATCHEVYPRLNGVGEAYRLNGYRFADEELYIKEEPVEMGDEAYKRLWPEAIWPSDIPGLPPISVRIMSDFTVDAGGKSASRTTFDFPHEIEIFMAGTLGDNLSFFSEIEFEDGGAETAAWLGFNDLFGRENVFNLKVGSLLMDAGLFTHRDHNRFTKSHYLYSSWMIPYSGALAATGATTNTYKVRGGQPGVELNGFNRSWYYAVGVVEGDTSLSEKDLYGQIAYKIGGIGFDGSGADVGEMLEATESWQDDSVTLSAFVHSGKRQIRVSSATLDSEDDFWRAGIGGLCRSGDLQFGGGYFRGRNENPYGKTALDNPSVNSRGWFVETAYFYKPWLIPSVRYEEVDMDIPSALFSTGQDQGRIVASVKAILRSNVTLTLEGMFYTTNQSKTQGTGELNDENALFARLDFAF